MPRPVSQTAHPEGMLANILFIMDDQHRHDYLGSAGVYFLQTPHLDRLAARGVRFTQCTTNAPVCAPSRIGLASGLHPGRLGCLDNSGRLPLGTTTYYQRLRDSGYRVGCVGKLDLRKSDGYNGRYGDRPYAYSWGFTHPEECEGKMHAGSSATPIGPYTHYLEEKGQLQNFHADYQQRSATSFVTDCRDSVLATEDFEDAYIGRRAAEWIEAVSEDFPWHYFVSFVGPHDPFDPPTEYGERYRDAPVPPAIADSLEGKPEWVKQRSFDLSADEIARTRRQYCAATQLIDDQIGLILDALERRGQLDNTYIIFASDHGEMLGDHGLYTKSAAYEASLRVPLIIAGPDIARGRVSDALCELIDLNATICEFAGLAPQQGIDARSLAPVLRGETDEHRQETVAELRNFRCVRTATHKYIHNYNDTNELYDLEKDPDELHNIAGDAPDLVADLARRMRRLP
jgi:choline-sulfatase